MNTQQDRNEAGTLASTASSTQDAAAHVDRAELPRLWGRPARGWITPFIRSAGITVLLMAAAAANAGGAGAIQGVVDGVNIVLATVTAICLALCTVGIGLAGYKIIFDGATFRDVSNKLLGSALAGSAAAVAGMFV